MNINPKKFIIAGTLTLALAAPAIALAEVQCPQGWVKEIHGVAEVCVAQNQNQSQSQTQNNNQNQNVNQNVVAQGGSSSSSSSSSSSVNITYSSPSPTATPQVVYQTQTYVKSLPATGLPETAAAASLGLPILGFALKKYGFKKSAESKEETAASIWLSKNS